MCCATGHARAGVVTAKPPDLQAEQALAPQPKRPWRVALRIGTGLLLLVLVAWHADPPALVAKLRGTHVALFAGAVASAVLANLVSAARWAAIARALGLQAPTARLVLAYARGITVNMLLPGGTLSGDFLRSYQLARLGNPLLRAALSVFFDRFSGLWVLCVMSLLAAAGVGLSGIARNQLPGGLAAYAALLAGVVVAPWLPWPTRVLRAVGLEPVRVLADRLDQLRNRIRGERGALLRSVWLSIAVQLLSAGTFWICLHAIGAPLPYLSTLAAAAPIFIMAALPLGFAGFGTRELGAVLVLGLLGVPADQATAASLLYGLAAVMQGLLGAPLFLLRT
jgi:uncharacterized membrane protein YbhN (UPF0104 family)